MFFFPRYKSHLLAFLCIFCLLYDSEPVAAQAGLPPLRNAGMIPVQWEFQTEGVSRTIQKAMFDDAFRNALKQAARFRMVNEDLVAQLWGKAEGRAQLQKEYELDTFIGLSVIQRADTIQLMVRLLNPSLENWLLESETKNHNWVASASQTDLDQLISSLVFRTLNRLPVDVSVTSIQGRFVTLSGGQDQNIVVGDKVEFLRASVESRHPSHGAWLGFKSFKLGSAEIVESNSVTSVAKLIGLSHENALEIGDGAKIPAIASRRKFRMEKSRFVDLQEEGSRSIILESKGPMGKLSDESSEQRKEGIEAGSSENEAESLTDMLSAKANDISIKFGMRPWSVKGFAAASAGIPSLLLNHVEAEATRLVGDRLHGEASLALDFGSTKNGSFMGIEADAAVFHRDDLKFDLGGSDSKWFGGGLARISTLGVSGERYGGMDQLVFGGILGAESRTEFFKRPLAMKASIHLIPLAFGQIGASGKKRSIAALLETGIKLSGIFLTANPQEWEFGGELSYSDSSYAVGSNKSLHSFDYSMLGIARYKF